MKAKTDFNSIIKQFEYQFDLRTVFNDFLSITLCAFAHNPSTGMSYYEEDYLAVIAKYKHSPLHKEFPRLLAQLIIEMEQRHDTSGGNDVLGEFYEQNIYRKGAAQYFTPPPICELMARSMGGRAENTSLKILDPACGSGRMLMSASRIMGKDNRFYGIDIDQTCVQMTTLNLFLNGLFDSEVMCSNALNPNDFNISYHISLLPFGIFRITDKESSRLWKMVQNSFKSKTNEHATIDKRVIQSDQNNSQLLLF